MKANKHHIKINPLGNNKKNGKNLAAGKVIKAGFSEDCSTSQAFILKLLRELSQDFIIKFQTFMFTSSSFNYLSRAAASFQLT